MRKLSLGVIAVLLSVPVLGGETPTPTPAVAPPEIPVAQYLSDLASNEFSVREKAKSALIKAGLPVAPRVIDLLCAQDPDVVNQASAILTNVGLAALPALCAAESRQSRAPVKAFIERLIQNRASTLLTDPLLTAEWTAPPPWNPKASLVVMTGSGHGGTLTLYRITPAGTGGCVILRIAFNEGRQSYSTRYPPAQVPVTVQTAALSADTFAAYTSFVSRVEAATLTALHSDQWTHSSSDFCALVSVEADGKALFKEAFVGYPSSQRLPFAKALTLSRGTTELLQGAEFADHTLTESERSWASSFITGWHYPDGHDWWVRERLLMMSGVVGDTSCLPMLQKTIESTSDQASESRQVYRAINAIANLTGKDVREKPLEDMDLEANRVRTLKMLSELNPKP